MRSSGVTRWGSRCSSLLLLALLPFLLLLLSPSLAVGSDVFDPVASAIRRHTRQCAPQGHHIVSRASVAALGPSCAGTTTRECEPGHYCTGGDKFACPAGVYGREAGLRSRACSAPCPAGFYCPPATATPLECGANDVYCPLGSSSPVAVPLGFYSLGSSATTRSSVARCPFGSFCVSGARAACPAGTYGASEGLSTSQCSGACPSGHYCPERSSTPVTCPSGSYGATTGLTTANCSGTCCQGFYCPPGSLSPTEKPCGPSNYCPAGSGRPTPAKPGEFVLNGNSGVAGRALPCPVGSYCSPMDSPGTAQFCPAGTFGDRSGLETSACAGKCAEGFYCPPGSTSGSQLPCGSVAVYCPIGSARPLPVSSGFYSVSAAPDERTAVSTETTRSAQTQCEPGHFCIDGRRLPCPPGTFGDAFGLSTPQCSGPCSSGFYCPPASIVSTAFQCGSSAVYCPVGSALPTPATTGHCTTPENESRRSQRSGQRLARPGEFAWRGTCYPCPPGSFGSREGESDPTCEGTCKAGYYCPPGSSSATQHECGLNATAFCPRGSVAPVSVVDGFYTSVADNGPPATIEALDSGLLAHECGPGRVRLPQEFVWTANRFMDLVTSRSVVSVSYRAHRFPVASCELCPLGTFKAVDAGDDPALCQPCPSLVAVSTADRRSCECYRLPGGAPIDSATHKLRFDRDARMCSAVAVSEPDAGLVTASSSGSPLDGRVTTRSEQFPCEPGFYCQRGVRFPCPAGSYGHSPRETRPECAGECAPGFYCPLSSTNRTAIACGDASVFCPAGSLAPTPVWPGYYTVRSVGGVVVDSQADQDVRDAQKQCEQGFFCLRGERFPCPAGRYGSQLGETSPLCSGNCKRGFYCPEGSISLMQRECGDSGDSGLVCRTGSSLPVAVPEGYYSVGGGNTTRFHLIQCEEGFFCSGGVKFQCPAGTFGSSRGLKTSACSGMCAPGYFCPSYPQAPSTSATQFECGDSSLYCPQGTGNSPRAVDVGFFSVGAGDSDGSDDEECVNARNTTRTAQQKCPMGFYCCNGVRIRCPEGTYGDVEGLSASQCRGWCPAGFACPAGTADYRENPCPVGTFAPRGSAACISCPATHADNRSAFLKGEDHLRRPCTHERACCYLG